MFMGTWTCGALLVCIGGPLWAIWMIPSYVKVWQTHPGLTGYLTQCMLMVFSPAFLVLPQAPGIAFRIGGYSGDGIVLANSSLWRRGSPARSDASLS